MNARNQSRRSPSRRQVLKHSAGAAALASAIAARAYAGESNTINVGLVGCGGRGGGALNEALSTKGPTKLVAIADVFQEKVDAVARRFADKRRQQMDLPPERCFVGFDAYRKAIDAVGAGGVIILATPPAFRPLHLEYAVQKGCHVFMEKSFAVDAPGVRRVLKAGEEAQRKNLKIAGGLMSRHSLALEQTIEQIHKGAIGEVITCWAYREHGPVGFSPKRPGESDLSHQIRNYSCFTWLNGSFLLDWLIHNIDVCCWVKNAWPVSAQGQGGRQTRTAPDQLFDHYAVEYTFPDGTRLFAQGRHMENCWGFFGCIIHGATGCGVLGEGIGNPRLYKGHRAAAENVIFTPTGSSNPYQREHDLLFDAIRNDRPYNETDRCARAAMAGILGRMAAESGQNITWDQAMASNLELAPGLDAMTWDSKPPVLPDADGRYPIAKPGYTKVL